MNRRLFRAAHFQVLSGLPKSALCKLPRWLSVRVQTLPPVEAIEVVKFR